MRTFTSYAEKTEITSPAAIRARDNQWAMYSFKGGLLQMTEALQKQITSDTRAEIKTDTPCTGLHFSGNKVKVKQPKLKALNFFIELY